MKKDKGTKKQQDSILEYLNSPEMEKVREIYHGAMVQYEKEANEFWNGLDDPEREMAFYHVLKKLHNGDVKRQASYRTVLYDIFGFDEGMYGLGMDCGYMEIHNLIGKGLDLEAAYNAKTIKIRMPGETQKHYKVNKDIRLKMDVKNGAVTISLDNTDNK